MTSRRFHLHVANVSLLQTNINFQFSQYHKNTQINQQHGKVEKLLQ